MHLLRTSTGVAVAHPGLNAGGLLPISMIIGIGRNYAEHAREQGAAVPDAPMVFSKNSASACLHNDDIIVPAICQNPRFGGDQVDFEGELGVIIAPFNPALGPTRDVGPADALKHVLGYCVANDISARWWQKTGSGGQFFRGKSFDTFCPIGPRVVPQSDVPDPQKLSIVTKVNNQVMQNGSTKDMIFSVRDLISDLSRGMTLLPGTLILTGTPSGVGMARTPPVWLRHHDVVEITIDTLGTLRNRVVFEGA